MKNYLIVFLLLLASCNNAQSRQLARQNLATYPWQLVTPMPHGRYGHDAVYASNGKIYVMGGWVFKVGKGFKKGKGLKGWMLQKIRDGRYSNLAYNPNTKQWEYVACVPSWRAGIRIYDPNTDQWSDRQGSLDNYSEEEFLKMSLPIDPNKKSIKVYATNLDRMGNGVAIASSRNQIFWTGGQNFGGNVENIFFPYELITDKWPKDTFKKIISNSSKPFWEYDQRELYQTTIPPMQEPRRDHRAVTTSDGKIYVLGGWHEGKAVNKWGSTYNTGKNIVSKTMECYDPIANKWEYKKPLIQERMLFAAVAGKDGKIYIFGGAAGMVTESQTPMLNTVEVYDPKNNSWSFRKPMPVKRSSHSAVLAGDGKIYVLGGSEVLDAPLNTVFIYDPEKDSWEKGPDMIVPRDAVIAVSTPDGKIYAIGGTDIGAYENKAQWEHLASLIPKDELGDYEGKVQDTVEVLDVCKWKKSLDIKNKQSE